MSVTPSLSDYWTTTSSLTSPDFRPSGIPLSPGCFHPTATDKVRYRALIQSRVTTLLKDDVRYADHRARNEPFVPPTEWQPVKKHHDLTFYQHRLPKGRKQFDVFAFDQELPEIQRAMARGYTSILGDGFVPGTMADLLYGMTDELMTGFSFKDPPKDCVWLGSVETATAADPFYTADLIWALPKLPPMFAQVDVCYVKGTGQDVDAQGKRYGYLVLHGVHIAQCPAFAAHGISRAKMYFACLFREPRPGVLKVTVRGIFDLSKKVGMLKGMISATTTSIMIGLLNGVGIGEAKKLTLLARRNRRRDRDRFTRPRQVTCSTCLVSRSGPLVWDLSHDLLRLWQHRVLPLHARGETSSLSRDHPSVLQSRLLPQLYSGGTHDDPCATC